MKTTKNTRTNRIPRNRPAIERRTNKFAGALAAEIARLDAMDDAALLVDTFNTIVADNKATNRRAAERIRVTTVVSSYLLRYIPDGSYCAGGTTIETTEAGGDTLEIVLWETPAGAYADIVTGAAHDRAVAADVRSAAVAHIVKCVSADTPEATVRYVAPANQTVVVLKEGVR